ncbi:MAG: class I SAM-dependent methyltransferase [Acidobacteriota bacterium]
MKKLLSHNRSAWDDMVKEANQWTVPVTAEQIAAARRGEWSIVLTSTLPVPREWFPPIQGLDVLALACGGGQQGPILAAAGGRVTVYDLSPGQLAQDRALAEREHLDLTAVEGDMCDLSAFADGSFDLVFNPVSNCFVPEVLPMWREAHRVLRSGGLLMTGFANPCLYLFDEGDESLTVRHRIPYSDTAGKTAEELAAHQGPLEFGHSLEDQIGGQLAAGFELTALYEDAAPEEPLSRFLPNYLATRARKSG